MKTSPNLRRSPAGAIDHALHLLVELRQQSSSQICIPFDNFGLTDSDQVILEGCQDDLVTAANAVKSRPKGEKISLEGLNLSLPFDALMGIETVLNRKSDEGQETCPPSKNFVDELPDSFGLPTIEMICFISAKLLYNALETLYSGDGRISAKSRREQLEWLLADEYVLDGVKAKKCMSQIPFTAQFACEVEEVPYALLKMCLEIAIEKNRINNQQMVVVDEDNHHIFAEEAEGFHNENDQASQYEGSLWGPNPDGYGYPGSAAEVSG